MRRAAPPRDGAAMSAAPRLAALGALAADLADCREELVVEIVRTLHKIVRVARGEVDLALRRLHAFEQVLPRLAGRAPAGGVALCLPGNAALSNPVATIGTAFLAGNRVLARFPAASRAWAERLEPLFTRRLPGVRFDRRPGPEFLAAALADPGIAVVMVFGDDAWIAAHEDRVRASGKKVIFEGPGKDPFLVLPGADLERAAQDAVRGGYYDAGQACTSPERFYVHASLFADFVGRVLELTAAEVVGEPRREEVTVGPIARQRVVERIAGQLREAEAAGARRLAGGRLESSRLRDGTPVTYVQPTVLTGVDSRLSIMRDETFGPVIPIQAVSGVEEALRLAGDSRYGLAANVYGGPEEAAAELATSHGGVFRDEIWLSYFSRNLHAPYGGRRRSGWVWEWRDGRFDRREGPRTNALEFSRPHASTGTGETAPHA
jgi:succinate-semialdehyde dehydrogenase/glutarate-semialdehyde dehydrogenase